MTDIESDKQRSEYLVFVDESGDHELDHPAPAYPIFVRRHFGHDQVILHEWDIRQDIGDFAFLCDVHAEAGFLDELSTLVDTMPMALVASVIRKDRLVAKSIAPRNPHQVALRFGLEVVDSWLKRHGESGRTCSGTNRDGAAFKLTPRFVSKAANVPGLQLADLCARPIGRHVLDPSRSN